MTNEEYLKTALEDATRRHGEDAFSTRQLRAQLASLQYFKKVKPVLSPRPYLERFRAQGPYREIRRVTIPELLAYDLEQILR